MIVHSESEHCAVLIEMAWNVLCHSPSTVETLLILALAFIDQFWFPLSQIPFWDREDDLKFPLFSMNKNQWYSGLLIFLGGLLESWYWNCEYSLFWGVHRIFHKQILKNPLFTAAVRKYETYVLVPYCLVGISCTFMRWLNTVLLE